MRRLTRVGTMRVHAATTALILTACSERAPRVVPAVAPGTTAPASSATRAAPSPPSGPSSPSPARSEPSGPAVFALPIPARAQAPESPPSGWCGETAIQEGLLHLGVWAPQRVINRAGRPAHPDLYAPEIPVALTDLGVRHAFYAGPRGFEAFARWARGALDAGDPVLAGVKILPTEHPTWGLDHFVLVVGHRSEALLVNTTWGTRQWVGDTTTPGLSFKNAFFGIRLSGLALPPGAIGARLTLVDEREGLVRLRVVCGGLTSGALYRLERRGGRGAATALWSEELTASGAQVEREVTVEADRTSRFHCAPR
jgi:hypothetical protein